MKCGWFKFALFECTVCEHQQGLGVHYLDSSLFNFEKMSVGGWRVLDRFQVIHRDKYCLAHDSLKFCKCMHTKKQI